MQIYIPQNLDPYNTHLKNLKLAYEANGVEVHVGYHQYLMNGLSLNAVHFHFLEGILKYLNYDLKIFFSRLEYFKNSGAKIIYTAHDAIPPGVIAKIDHEQIFREFFEYVDLIVHHGSKSIEIFSDRYPKIKSIKNIVCHHGNYLIDMQGFKENKNEAREILKEPRESKMILIFGQLQYKNTAFAKSVIKQIEQEYTTTILYMAGVSPIFPKNKLNKIYYFLNNNIFNLFRKKHKYIFKRFSQYETYLLFKASDLIFLPHKAGLTSGIIHLAATLGKPFVYPDIGVFAEQAENCYALKYPKGDYGLAISAIKEILRTQKDSFDNEKWLANNDWNEHAVRILQNLSS